MYCNNCGNQIDDGCIYCPKCGQRMTSSLGNPDSLWQQAPPMDYSEPTDDIQAYRKFIPRSKSIDMMSCAVSALTLLMVIALVFVPIFSFSYVPNDLDDWEIAWEKIYGEELQLSDWFDLLERDAEALTGKFSLYDDVMALMASFSANASSDDIDDQLNNIFLVILLIFPLGAVITACVLAIIAVVQLCDSISMVLNCNRSALLKYSEIKKSGKLRYKEGFFKKQSLTTMIICIILDIVFVRYVYGALLQEVIVSDFDIAFLCYMPFFSGLSSNIVIIVIGLIAYIALKVISKNQITNLVFKINCDNGFN